MPPKLVIVPPKTFKSLASKVALASLNVMLMSAVVLAFNAVTLLLSTAVGLTVSSATRNGATAVLGLPAASLNDPATLITAAVLVLLLCGVNVAVYWFRPPAHNPKFVIVPTAVPPSTTTSASVKSDTPSLTTNVSVALSPAFNPPGLSVLTTAVGLTVS
ncbi:MAG: hypothetical protein EBW19_12575, partial [Betaproteobacteria bacterium]|nr:hypothetical protein [Betaproteobacteria bacterium]